MSTYTINKNILFTMGDSYVVIDGKPYHLRKQCKLLFEILVTSALKGKYASLENIGKILWYEDGGWGPDKRQSLSDCLTDLKLIIGKESIENIHGEGYKLCYTVELSDTTKDILKDSIFANPQKDLSVNELIDEVHRTTAAFSWVTYEIEKMEKLIQEATESDPKTSEFLFRELDKLNATTEEFRRLKLGLDHCIRKMEDTADYYRSCNTFGPVHNTSYDSFNSKPHTTNNQKHYGIFYMQYIRASEICEKFERHKHDLYTVLGIINTGKKQYEDWESLLQIQ